MPPSPAVKIYYFCAAGRANQIRLALAAGGVSFEDEFGDFPPSPETKAKWSALTNNNTTFAAPFMTLDEGSDSQKVYMQSSACLRKAGRMGGLKLTLADDDDDDDDQALYLQDKLIADAEDLRSASYKAFAIFGASREATDKFVKNEFPRHVDNLERQLVALGGDYFGGSSTLSIADVTLYDAIVFFGTRLIDGVEGLENPCGPALKAWIERVESNENIANYLKSDQFKALVFVPDKSTIGY
mmetsp:Transcript_18178/g.37817  ORF Transcript_18178/g.37817 Transcript_18178/m.37817 type:complete len:242 (-) Transcript_18178:395-1120(-)